MIESEYPEDFHWCEHIRAVYLDAERTDDQVDERYLSSIRNARALALQFEQEAGGEYPVAA